MTRHLHRFYMITLMTNILFLQSCLDEIELDAPKGQSDAVVVQGKLSVGEETQVEVFINKLFTFDGSSTTLRVKYVDIINDKDEKLTLDFVEEGVYFITINEDHQFEINSALSYKIKMELFDGRIIESNFEPLKSFEAQNSVSLSIQEKPIINRLEDESFDKERIVIDLQSEINNSTHDPQRFRWFVNVTQKITDIPQLFGIQNRVPKACYYTSTFAVKEQVLFNGFEADKKSSLLFESEVFCGRLNDGRYADTVYFNIIQESLTQGAYDFYNSIDKSLELSGSMFDPAAGKIVSNLINVTSPDEEVFGYFYATDQEQANVRLTPDVLGRTPSNPCLSVMSSSLQEGQCAFVACCDCNGRSDEIPQKPDYWN